MIALIPTARINDPWSALAFPVMAGLVPAIRRGTVPPLMAGTSPAVTARERRQESAATAVGINPEFDWNDRRLVFINTCLLCSFLVEVVAIDLVSRHLKETVIP
jgi:hypothetical protein